MRPRGGWNRLPRLGQERSGGDEDDTAGDDGFDNGRWQAHPTERCERDGDRVGECKNPDDGKQTPPRTGSQCEGGQEQQVVVSGEDVMKAVTEKRAEGGEAGCGSGRMFDLRGRVVGGGGWRRGRYSNGGS